MADELGQPLASDNADAGNNDPRGGVFSVSFLALVATQFFVSLNDNMFRWLIVPIGKELLTKRWDDLPSVVTEWTTPETLALSLGLACFTLPFLLLAAPAGYLADRFSKRKVMVVCKAVEIAVIGLGITAILAESVPLMFVMLFMLGGQSMMFITSKFGAIPELVRSDKIAAANGLINMVSMSAIIIGAVAGNWLYDLTKPSGQMYWWYYAAALLSVATCGWITSLFVGRLPAADPTRRFPWNPAKQTFRDLELLFSRRSLFLAALGSTYFWLLAAISQINIDQFATKYLGVAQQDVGPMLAVVTLGIAGGAVLAGVVSRGKVELGLVPFGGFGMALMAILMIAVPGGEGHVLSTGYITGCALLGTLGIAAGFYEIPLQAFIQDRSAVKSRGSIMAAYNFMTFAGMLAASGVYWVLAGALKLNSPMVFLVVGVATVLVTLFIVRRLPVQTTHLLIRVLVACMFRVRMEGQDKVPRGGVLLVSNHVSWADGVLFGLACPRLPRMIAFAQYFDSPWLGWFGRLSRVIPIGTTRKSMVDSIRTAREALRQGELVCIFPEGGITRTGELQEFRPGFLTILKDTDCPVVPVYLDGLWGSIFSYKDGRFFWKWPRHWRYPVTIRFGDPIHRPESVEEVREAVVALQKQGDNEFVAAAARRTLERSEW